MNRILVCGDRNWSDADKIRDVLKGYSRDSVVIHGGCSGADTIAGFVAKELGMTVIVFKAEWNKYGLSAGPIRNKKMLDEGKPDIVIAFHSDIASSKGTKNMISQSRAKGVETRLIT